MKQLRTIFVVALGALTIAACNTTNDQVLQNESATGPQVMAKDATEADCSVDCIDLSETDPYYEISESETIEWGGGPNGSKSKTVSYTAYNTESDFVVEVYYETNNGPGSGNDADLIEVTVDGSTQDEEDVASGSTTTFTFPLAAGWSACEEVEFDILQDGQQAPIEFEGTYSLFEVCCEEESFDYEDHGNNSYTFTYTPDEDVNDAHLVFTFAQGVAVSGLSEWSTHGVTRQKTMDLEACQAYSWTVELEANCSGHSGQSNVWTDFKVNDVSKKGSLDNIVQTCE